MTVERRLFYCKYGCGKNLLWRSEYKMPVEIENDGKITNIEHTFKRCADIQKEQGRKPYFFDRTKKIV